MTDFVADLFATDLIPVKVPVGSDGFSVVYAISPVACIFVLAFACVLVRKIVQAVRS